MYIKKGPTVKRVRFTNPIITWQFDFDSSKRGSGLDK